jgi:deoxyinosine 3'endonuclease (endonuclease V)
MIGGCFVCFARGAGGRGTAGEPGWAGAALAIGSQIVTSVATRGQAGHPYEPGMLALREGPLLEAAVRALPQLPDVLLVNATGRDHPLRAGLALHLGAVLQLPTIGITHRPLLAQGKWPPDELGARSPLLIDAEEVGVLAADPTARAATGGAPGVAHRRRHRLRRSARRCRLGAGAGAAAGGATGCSMRPSGRVDEDKPAGPQPGGRTAGHTPAACAGRG